MLSPSDVDAVLFDVVGTLVDEDRAFTDVAERLATVAEVHDAAALSALWTERLDRRMRAVVEGEARWRPHRALVRDAAGEAIAAAGGRPTSAALDLAASLDRSYRAWPDVARGTAALRRGRLVACVSNADLDALARLANRNAISWDAALSAGSVRTFKPAAAAYRHAIDALALDPSRTLFAAAHPWDLRAASEHGFRTAFIARPGAERPAPADAFDLDVHDVCALADLLAGAGA